MGAFDSPSDAPFQIRTEGENITINFANGLPTTGQGTISWNIPAPAQGCQNTDGRGAYCGMLITVSNVPSQPRNAPKDGIFYQPDPTADNDAHAGDKIGEALVLGAFYEGEQRARNEAFTTSFVISDLKPKTQYFVTGYAVDCQGRYHTKGVRAYSDLYGGEDQADTTSTQVVVLGDGDGVLPTDGTGLMSGFIYQFELDLDPTFPSRNEARTILVSVDGTDVSTYDALIVEINKAIALADNPPQSPVAPNTGRYFWDATNQKLYQWDGNQNIEQDVLIEDTDPATPASGDYWYSPTTDVLQRWDIPTLGVWNSVNIITYQQDPTMLSGGNDYWFDGINGYYWCGETWCQSPLVDSPTDPTIVDLPTNCGVFWYDESSEELFEWNLEQLRWVQQFAIMWNVAPTNLTSGTYWFDSTNNELNQRTGSPLVWTNIPPRGGSPAVTPSLEISETAPVSPTNQLHWYKPSTEQLFIYDGVLMVWNASPVLVWPDDPTNPETCDLWWNTTNDTLFKWDIVNSEWDEVLDFTKSPVDPLTPPTFNVGDLWYNTTTEVLSRWSGLQWIEVTYIDYPTDPSQPVAGDTWHNPIADTWFVWSGSPSMWTAFDPIDSDTDPFLLPNGTLWFSPVTTILNERAGAAWLPVPYSTIPFTPATGELWFDSTNNVLMEWDGTLWVLAEVLADVSLTEGGHMLFETTFTGSQACTMILVPFGSESGVFSREVAVGQAGVEWHAFSHYGDFDSIAPIAATVPLEQFLFDFLTPQSRIARQIYGTDGLSSTPSYEIIGSGDDGTPDERRELADSVRSQLGYPQAAVELTGYQINKSMDLALRSLRKRSSAAYRRGFFFLDVKAGSQHYALTNETVGFNKVVTVMAAYRFTSAFLSTAHGSGVYGQVVLQHLYNMGTFDLLSFHLVSQYVEQLEHLFATRLTFHWDESRRLLSFYNSFTAPERILLDVTLERTEQELMKDRWTRSWIERYTLAESMRILAQVRGKYASLPGAGGGISLNASELLTQHNEIKEDLYQQLDDFIVNDVEDIGMQSTFIIG